MARTHSPPPADYVEAVRTLYEAGERDLLGGGVPACKVARHLGVSESSAHHHLTSLADDGTLTAVDGADPESLRCRKSYIPADISPPPAPSDSPAE